MTSSPCLRGRLPDADGLTVGQVATFAAERHRDALCERGWAAGLVDAVAAHNRAADAAAEGPR